MELKNSMKSVMVSGLCALFLAGQPAWSGTGRNKVPLNNAVSVATGRPKVKYSKACASCSLKEICLPKLEKAGSVKEYLKRALEEEPG